MNKSITDFYRMPLALMLVASLAACGTDSGPSAGGSSPGGGSGSGFTLRLTDAPFDDAVRVDVWFNAVRVKQAGGTWIEIPAKDLKANVVGLASLQGTKNLELVSGFALPPGDYSELRLIVDDSRSEIEFSDGSTYDLEIPTGSNPGLMVKEPFTITEGRATDMVIDFDLRRSIRKTNSAVKPYRMAPILRVAFGSNYSHIRNKVDGSMLVAGSCSDGQADTFNAAYVFKGDDAKLEDISEQPKKHNPITTAKIFWDEDEMSYVYEVGFLPAGEYTVALTCNANLDDPEKNDNVKALKFFGVKNVTVKVNDISFL